MHYTSVGHSPSLFIINSWYHVLAMFDNIRRVLTKRIITLIKMIFLMKMISVMMKKQDQVQKKGQGWIVVVTQAVVINDALSCLLNE